MSKSASDDDVCPAASAFKSDGLSASIVSRFVKFLAGGGAAAMRFAIASKSTFERVICGS